MQLFRLMGESITFYLEETFFMVTLGLITLLSCVLILPAPFALAGLWVMAQRNLDGSSGNWQIYKNGIKQYGVRAAGLCGILFIGYVLVATNIWFYNSPLAPFTGTPAIIMTGLWVLTTVLLTGTAFYALTFLIEQEEPNIWLALRNSIYLTLLHPVAIFIWLVLLLLLTLLSVMLPVFLVLLPGYVAILSLHAERTFMRPILEAKRKTDEERKLQDQDLRTSF